MSRRRSSRTRAVLLADMRARRKRYESLNVIWWRILLPLSTPVLIAITIFSFVAHWNDFLNPLIYLFSEDKKTLALGCARSLTQPMRHGISRWPRRCLLSFRS